ncbi:TniQ family protein [Roseovarius sp. M141]|uniref:TniQ family protein n=1 Tax=Roseovarius sp. M141 TaxID=2583806 RepID=UPI0020CDD346|nr:TniQ family protein [Roseovarius sp. M141]MCQ0090243.1 TniQ family protein [Roseovarius sp. M141]
MTVLPLKLKASPFEMPASFASRLAQLNGCRSLGEFAVDLSLDVRGLTCGDDVALNHLREIASLPDDVFANTRATEHSDKAIRIGHEVYRSSIFSRGEIRFCPRCVAADVQAGGSVWHAVHRLHWQIRQVTNCIEHHQPLETEFVGKSMFGNLDPSRVFANHLAQCARADATDNKRVRELDAYLSLRAYGHQKPCWADRLEIFALLKATTALGLLIARGSSAKTEHLDPQDAAELAEMGFQIIKGGPASLRECWENIRLSAKYHDGLGRYQPHPRFGAFQRLLASDLKYRSDFAPIRRVFRDYLIDTFPFADGADVLGEKLTRRRLHSLLSAQRTIGRRTSTFHDKLLTEGFATRDDSERLVLIKPLTVSDVDRFSGEINALLYEREAAVFVGITVESFRLLADAGLVPASLVGQKSRPRAFQKCELDVFRDKLLSGLPHIQTVNRDQTMIAKAPLRLNCDLKALVAAILAGRLKPAGLWRGKERLDHIVVDLAGAKAALPNLTRPVGIQRIPTFRMLRFNNTTLNHLVEHGFLTGFRAQHPVSRLMTEFISTESIQRFNQSYVSLGILAHQDGAVGGPQFAKLRNAGMHPIIDQPGLSKIYQRSDLSAIYAAVGLDLGV